MSFKCQNTNVQFFCEFRKVQCASDKMEPDKKPTKQNGIYRSLSKITKRFSFDNKSSSCNSLCIPNCGCLEEPPLAGEITSRNRKENIFRSLKKKFRGNKLNVCKSKQRVNAVDEQLTCQLAFIQQPPPVAPRVYEEKVPTPPPRNVITQELDEAFEDGKNAQYIGLDELNQYELSPMRSSLNSNKSLGKEHFDLAKYGWFWGPITKREAESRLIGEPDGSFLVRDSSSERHIFTLSFRSYGQTLHSHIDYNRGVYSMGDHLTKRSVAELIDAAIDISKEQVFSYSKSRNPADPAFPVRLSKPISRLTEVRSLKYLCRFIIRQYINVNNIQKLPLPTTLKNYLQQGQY